MAQANPRFANTPLPYTQQWEFQDLHFLKNKKPSFYWQMKRGENWVWELPAKCVCEAHPELGEFALSCGESGSAQFPSGLHEYSTAKHSAPGRSEKTEYL